MEALWDGYLFVAGRRLPGPPGSVAANIDYSLVSDLSYFFLQLRIGPTDLFMVVPRNDAIFPKLHTNQYISCYRSPWFSNTLWYLRYGTDSHRHITHTLSTLGMFFSRHHFKNIARCWITVGYSAYSLEVEA